MTINYYTNLNNSNHINFRENKASDIVQKPIEKTSAIINDTVDKFTNTNESKEKKNNRKKVIGIVSSVFVLSGLMLLLNPKVSPKITQKLKNISEEAKNNIQKHKDNPIISTYYKVEAFLANAFNKGTEFVNTANSSKDYFFEWFCRDKKGEKIKNNTLRKIVTNVDKGIRTVFSKPHKAITNFFDKIGKSTVIRQNKNASKDIDIALDLINKHKSKLSSAEQKIIENEIKTIEAFKQGLSKENVEQRLLHQESLMNDLRSKFGIKFENFRKGFKGFNSTNSFKDTFTHNKKHLSDNMTFWTRDMLQPAKEELEKENLQKIATIIGDNNKKGAFKNILEKMSTNLSETERNELLSKINIVNKSIQNAHNSEYLEYFDKKRDLIMGGAPTDILSGLALLSLSGILIGKADSREEKFSKLLTATTPVILGFGSSIALTAMLFSGPKGMAIGSGVGAVISGICNYIDKYIHPNLHKKEVDNNQNLNN